MHASQVATTAAHGSTHPRHAHTHARRDGRAGRQCRRRRRHAVRCSLRSALNRTEHVWQHLTPPCPPSQNTRHRSLPRGPTQGLRASRPAPRARLAQAAVLLHGAQRGDEHAVLRGGLARGRVARARRGRRLGARLLRPAGARAPPPHSAPGQASLRQRPLQRRQRPSRDKDPSERDQGLTCSNPGTCAHARPAVVQTGGGCGACHAHCHAHTLPGRAVLRGCGRRCATRAGRVRLPTPLSARAWYIDGDGHC